MLLTDSFELGFELRLVITGSDLKVVVRVRALLMDRRCGTAVPMAITVAGLSALVTLHAMIFNSVH